MRCEFHSVLSAHFIVAFICEKTSISETVKVSIWDTRMFAYGWHVTQWLISEFQKSMNIVLNERRSEWQQKQHQQNASPLTNAYNLLATSKKSKTCEEKTTARKHMVGQVVHLNQLESGIRFGRYILCICLLSNHNNNSNNVSWLIHTTLK